MRDIEAIWNEWRCLEEICAITKGMLVFHRGRAYVGLFPL